jgi:hypothetical protein
MIIRKILVAAATIAALSPAISTASPEKASAKACASAFASSLAAAGSTAPTYKFAYRGGLSTSLADFYPTEYSFTLEAHDPKTGAPIARAVCTTDYRGAVTGIAAVPLTGNPTSLAASF